MNRREVLKYAGTGVAAGLLGTARILEAQERSPNSQITQPLGKAPIFEAQLKDATLHAVWVHGNVLTVETPENLARVGHFGWGADMLIKPGKSSWFHLPLPTPVIVSNVRTKVQRVFLLFKSTSGSIRNVHVYDGSSKIQEFNDLSLKGEHRLALDGQNTFNLATPHTVIWGVGISFFFVADIGFDTAIPPAQLIVGTAGGDFSS